MGNALHPNIIWVDIKKEIEYAIINGTYKSASKMPSISEVSDKYSCGKSTAQKVLEEMFNDGIITKTKGVGYFVKPYAKDILFEKYMNILQSELNQSIQTSLLLGLKEEQLKNKINDIISEVYSR